MGNVCETSDKPNVKNQDKPEQEVAKVGRDRRRLSIGALDGVASGTAADDDRGILQQLNSQNVIETAKVAGAAGEVPGLKMSSLGSSPDTRTGRRNSFTEKGVENFGETLTVEDSGIGYTCMKGLKPESPNQDSWSVLRSDGQFSIYGVYDGHGAHGHTISNFVKENLPKLIVKDVRFRNQTPELLKDAFEQVQRLIVSTYKDEAQFSGTTATVVVHDHEANTITIGHAGDCTVVIGTKAGAGFTGTSLTVDHKPNLPEEKERITKAGGRVVWDGFFNYRVAARDSDRPGLNMSRCMGDLFGHDNAGLSCVPELLERKLTPEDAFLCICSDGVWEFVKPQDAADMVAPLYPGDIKGACAKVAKESWDRWITEEGDVVDDITCVIVNLKKA